MIAGAVRLDGHDVRDVTLASLRGQVAIVPQETLLFGGTVRENPGCPECGYVGWVVAAPAEFSELWTLRRPGADPQPHRSG